jgi:Fur family ferric uptake transcriptional regulator
VCRHCGNSIELENDEIERWTKDVADRYEFSEVTHDLVLFGTCKTCGLARLP